MCLSPSVADRALDPVFSKDSGVLQVVTVRDVACSCGLHYVPATYVPRRQMPTPEEEIYSKESSVSILRKVAVVKQRQTRSAPASKPSIVECTASCAKPGGLRIRDNFPRNVRLSLLLLVPLYHEEADLTPLYSCMDPFQRLFR